MRLPERANALQNRLVLLKGGILCEVRRQQAFHKKPVSRNMRLFTSDLCLKRAFISETLQVSVVKTTGFIKAHIFILKDSESPNIRFGLWIAQLCNGKLTLSVDLRLIPHRMFQQSNQ